MSFEKVIELKELARYFEVGGDLVKALDGVNLDIGRGEYVSLVGPSGSGKTTLFNMIGGLDRPTQGSVYIDGVDISKLDAYELAWLRCRRIGYIFQSFNLIQVLTALENVALPTVFAGLPRDEGNDKAQKLLESVGLGERLHHKPTQLSAGQQQRVAIARALANDPAIILADEPTGNLDLKTGTEIIDLLHKLNRSKGLTLVAATHDLKMIKASDRVVMMRDGKIEKIEKGEAPLNHN
ncbi:ABC transporter ATP-binding protein [Candidatus Bathyarchaeota archaeon]|nr:ABC transporter ATP-binding protein [Candidatus Bathyarchaeota archaeon]